MPSANNRDDERPPSIFDRWVGDRQVSHLGSNVGATPLAFQRWHHFKEAFPPELIRQMITDDKGAVDSCLDVFGGSGTTALASQLLGIASTTIEINPFLADVIRAKTTPSDADALALELKQVIQRAKRSKANPEVLFAGVPATFVEPGSNDRWVFDLGVAKKLAQLLSAIASIESDEHRRFFRVMVGGILTAVSNVVINGKGRRYRRNWKERRRDESKVFTLFTSHTQDAIDDVREFVGRPDVATEVLLGDAREVSLTKKHDLSIFSPPYPNSFDYTDIYNLELWMLGYLKGSDDNRRLRKATFSSHVQLQREFGEPPAGSKVLNETIEQLEEIRAELWNPWIPKMVGGYFADMMKVLEHLHLNLRESGRCCIVVGDSRYGGVLVPTAKILAELSQSNGWKIDKAEPVRAMRSSAQHGGSADLDETLLILVRNAD